MFLQIVASLSNAVHAVYGWFWDFLHDGYGNIALTIVFGMVIFCIVFRFLLMPLFGRQLNLSGVYGFGNWGSDSAKVEEKPHPDFSFKDAQQSRADSFKGV